MANSEKIPSAAEPDSGLVIIIGKVSVGIFNFVKRGFNKFDSISIAPDALKIENATINATKYGIIEIASLNPSFAPSTNSSYTFIFLHVA